jgi:hypothetical protein
MCPRDPPLPGSSKKALTFQTPAGLPRTINSKFFLPVLLAVNRSIELAALVVVRHSLKLIPALPHVIIDRLVVKKKDDHPIQRRKYIQPQWTTSC